MKKRLLFILLSLSIAASVTGFTPVKNEPKGWRKIFTEALRNIGLKDEAIPYTYQSQSLILENSDGISMYSGNYFQVALSSETAKAHPKLAKWISAYNEETAASVQDTIYRTASDVYDMFDSGWEAAYDLSNSFFPVRSDAEVFSFIEGAYTYAGGAHGYQSFESHNIDPETGEEISFYDVVADTKDLPEILFREVLKQNEDLVDWFGDLLEDETAWKESLERKSFTRAVETGLNEIPVSLAWALDYDGVRFYFNDYSLGSYAAGARNCILKFKDYPDLFTDKYFEIDNPGIEKIAVQEDSLESKRMHLFQYDAVSAYADFLNTYMGDPVIAEDSELGEDIPESVSDVRVNVIYLDDDEIPELVIANGDGPENPVHLFSYDPELQEVSLNGSFSMYGKMYYEPKTGNFIPMYYLPNSSGEVYQYENGNYELKESWLEDYSEDTPNFFINDLKTSEAEVEKTSKAWMQHPFRPVFSEYRAISLENIEDLKRTLKRAAGLDYVKGTLDGVWKAEEGEFTYLELEEKNFAVYDENGYSQYMGVIGDEDNGLFQNAYTFDAYTPDGGYFSFGRWLQADDPLEDAIDFKGQMFKRVDTTGTGNPVRSVGQFLSADIKYLGEHEAIGYDGSLRIEQENVQTGGYKVIVDFGNGITGEGFANLMTNGSLYINYGETGDGKYFTGEIAYEESTMEYDLKVQDSPSEKIPEGTRFSFSY